MTTSIPPNTIAPNITSHDWEKVETQMPHAREGVRVLVHRVYLDGEIIVDYITERIEPSSSHNEWKHITAYHRKGERHPYPFQYNGSHHFSS